MDRKAPENLNISLTRNGIRGYRILMPQNSKIGSVFRYLTAVLFLLIVSGCASRPVGSVSQFATIDSLLAGVYEGEFQCADVLKRGNLGLGTFEELDGEMIVVGGRMYQVTSDGRVHRPSGRLGTPFATVARFSPDLSVQIVPKNPSSTPDVRHVSLAGLEKHLDQLCPNRNGIYAFEIAGTFSGMTVRSVPKQNPPYRELVEVVKEQTVFELAEAEPVTGTLVGFRFPEFFRGVNAPGYHFHFLTHERKRGGHVLNLAFDSPLRVRAMTVHHFELFLPADSKKFAEAELGRDRTEELNKVER